MAETCEACGQLTLGKFDYRDLTLSLSESVWRARVTLCPDCLEAVLDELGLELPAEVGPV